jgi:hypothetical protein
MVASQMTQKSSTAINAQRVHRSRRGTGTASPVQDRLLWTKSDRT